MLDDDETTDIEHSERGRPEGDDAWLLSRIQYELPPGGEAFLIGLSDALDRSSVRSILLFGSVVTGEVSEMSDIDILIILSEDTPRDHVSGLKAECDRLARNHLTESKYPPGPFENFIERRTGMFRSGFVTTEDAVAEGRFPDVFNTSSAVYLLAPWRTVMYSVFSSGETVVGSAVEPDWNEVGHPLDHRVGELVRSWAMTTVLATTQIPYRLVSPRTSIYALEALKWTIYTCAFHIHGGPLGTLEESLAVVPIGPWATRQFVESRRSNRVSIGFLLLMPTIVWLAHFRTLIRTLYR